MLDTQAATLEHTILQHRPLAADVSWADEIVFPYYNGLSIRNLAHTVVRLLDVRPANGYLGTAPLQPELWEPYWGQTQRVILFISDGLGWQLLQQLVAEDDAIAQIVADLSGDHPLVPITSIAPSTTAAALPCIWTGTAPVGTGMAGTLLFLRELGVVADMLHFTPFAARRSLPNEVLEAWGLDMQHLLPVQTLGEKLSERQIDSTVILQSDLAGSGLSRLMHRGVAHMVRHIGYTDLWLALRQVMHSTRNRRCFVNVYWSAVDSLSHFYGTISEPVIYEIRQQLAALRDVILDERSRDGRTLFMLVADHGHAPVPDTVAPFEHPLFAAAVRITTGDSRFAHLFLRDGSLAEVMAALRENYGEKIWCVPTADALEAGLFGPEKPHVEAAARLGDLIVVAREGMSLLSQWRQKPGPLSRHAGMSAREMMVPLLLRPI